MYIFITVSLILCMALALFRAFVGPTTFDRILAANTFGTLTVIFICIHNFLTDRPEFLDIALVYALINFIGTLAVAKYVRDAHFNDTDDLDLHGDI